MGVFSVSVELKNWQNQFLPEDRRGEDLRCDALVDTGAAELALLLTRYGMPDKDAEY